MLITTLIFVEKFVDSQKTLMKIFFEKAKAFGESITKCWIDFLYLVLFSFLLDCLWPYCWHMVLTPLRFKTKIMGSIILDENQRLKPKTSIHHDLSIKMAKELIFLILRFLKYVSMYEFIYIVNKYLPSFGVARGVRYMHWQNFLKSIGFNAWFRGLSFNTPQSFENVHQIFTKFVIEQFCHCVSIKV